MKCSCGRLKVGGQLTEARNLNPDCEEHGIASDWYRSPEQVEKRRAQNQRIRDLFDQARAARKAAQ